MKDNCEVVWFVGLYTSHNTDIIRFVKLKNYKIVIINNYKWTEKDKDLKTTVNGKTTIDTI